ncbi:MAG: HAMP domain-containing protein [Candidatus Eremiobacterota bacterium]
MLFLICLATLPAVLFIFFVAQSERTRVLARMQQDALHLVDLASREHAHQIQGARELLSWLGRQMSREGLRSPMVADPRFLGTLVAGHPQIANIGVLSPDGEVLASAYPLSTYRTWKDNPAYLAALRSNQVAAGTYLVSPIFAQPTLNHAYAVRGDDDRVIAVLFNGLNLDWLSEIGEKVRLPDGFSLFIADRHGRVLARAGHVHAQLAGNDVLRIPGIADLARLRRASVAELGGLRGTFVAAPLEGAPGLFVAVGLPFERAVQQANSTFYRTLATLGLLTLFVIAAVLTSAELGILRGLRSLARTAQKLGAGDLSVRASVPRSHDEFASLAATFNAMADSLAARHREAIEAQDRLRALTSRLQVAREDEATRIARELHDEVGQMLTALKIDLLRLRPCCSQGEQALPCATALREGTAAMSQQVDAAIGFVRRISSDLRPGVLDRLGLTAALEWLARQTEARTGLAIQVEADVGDATLDEPRSVALFRIAQEALNNVIRHAQASVVDIGLTSSDEHIVLTVCDNGKGITIAEVESNTSLGIIGMCERAALVNGCVSVCGSPEQGTTVRVTVPLPPGVEGVDAYPAGG